MSAGASARRRQSPSAEIAAIGSRLQGWPVFRPGYSPLRGRRWPTRSGFHVRRHKGRNGGMATHRSNGKVAERAARGAPYHWFEGGRPKPNYIKYMLYISIWRRADCLRKCTKNKKNTKNKKIQNMNYANYIYIYYKIKH